MVDLSAHQPSLDEVDGFQAQVADRSHPGVGRAPDGQCDLRFLAGGVPKPSGCECSRCVDGGGIRALSKPVCKLPRHVLGHLGF